MFNIIITFSQPAEMHTLVECATKCIVSNTAMYMYENFSVPVCHVLNLINLHVKNVVAVT